MRGVPPPEPRRFREPLKAVLEDSRPELAQTMKAVIPIESVRPIPGPPRPLRACFQRLTRGQLERDVPERSSLQV